MNEQQMIDLVQAGIDGELAADEQDELAQLLESSAEARELHAQLAGVAAVLGRAEPLEPPADLHARIMGSIELPAPRRRWFSFGQAGAPGPLGYGLAAVAGAIFTFAALTVVDTPFGPDDTRDMVGTIAPVAATRVGAERFDAAAGRGSLELYRLEDGGYRLDVAVDASSSLDWRIDLDGSGLVLSELTSLQGQPGRVDWPQGRILGEDDTTVRLSAALQADPSADAVNIARVGWVLSADGTTVHRGGLTAD
ncbi:hypothetical protein F3N42_02960 [Marinihelvus fidelis]|uniref:Anti-sigma factor n=1 Tax=Marinihelvus fidelis TaxID=2613842 RepID=A0A5N0TFQ4_9GAMM|nr:hypothetical protein [Marinihelvus fidelis]KAA9133328.1 hypothetical protein F3N42_02960 [Marinihelvus fidelis]